jgi:hypothetical protein
LFLVHDFFRGQVAHRLGQRRREHWTYGRLIVPNHFRPVYPESTQVASLQSNSSPPYL